MFTKAMKIVLLFIMKNHMYTFNNEIKLQARGGPIGLELTGVLAQLFMVWWDRQFVNKVEDNGLKLRVYKKHVDDINVIMDTPSSALRFVEGEVIQDEHVAELEQDIETDRRSMLLVQSIGNSVHKSIELEVDYPSRHRDGKLPILDLKVWVEKRNRVIDNAQEHEVKVVLHEFYYKDVLTRSTVNARSALP